jgi:hypothetical protein
VNGKNKQFQFGCKTVTDKKKWIQLIEQQLAKRTEVKHLIPVQQNKNTEGYLYKQGEVIKSWKLRYFILHPGSATMYYFYTKEDLHYPLGRILLVKDRRQDNYTGNE